MLVPQTGKRRAPGRVQYSQLCRSTIRRPHPHGRLRATHFNERQRQVQEHLPQPRTAQRGYYCLAGALAFAFCSIRVYRCFHLLLRTSCRWTALLFPLLYPYSCCNSVVVIIGLLLLLFRSPAMHVCSGREWLHNEITWTGLARRNHCRSVRLRSPRL